MFDLKETLMKQRPTLSESSITTYNSILKNLHKKVFGDDNSDHMEDFQNTSAILSYLKDIPPNRRKTQLSALVVLTGLKAYRDAMLDDIKEYNIEISKQEKTPTQKANWLEPEVLETKLTQLKRDAELLYKKKNLTQNDLQQIQNYILLVLFTGTVPRRSLDYVDFRIDNVDKKKHNYLERNEMVFNSYKTAKAYGQQRVSIPIKMKNILRKWIKVNPTPYLLFDRNYNPLPSVKLNQRLNKIFDGKKISVNALRHSFLTEKYGDISEDMSDMGSSLKMVATYVKKE